LRAWNAGVTDTAEARPADGTAQATTCSAMACSESVSADRHAWGPSGGWSQTWTGFMARATEGARARMARWCAGSQWVAQQVLLFARRSILVLGPAQSKGTNGNRDDDCAAGWEEALVQQSRGTASAAWRIGGVVVRVTWALVRLGPSCL